jgi:hypothetical protein
MKNYLLRLFLHTSPFKQCWRLLQGMTDSVGDVRPARAYPLNLKKVRVPGFQQQHHRVRRYCARVGGVV